MSNCLRCEQLETETESEYLVKVVEFKHPVYGWMKAHNNAVKVCNICLLYMKSITEIKIAFKEIEA
jgi:hypothetical protein